MKQHLPLVGVLVAVILIIAGMVWYSSTPGAYDSLAQCLSQKGVKFYGAFWCPHCQEQKSLFGRSSRLLPYIECSTPDGRGQLKVCQDAKIEGYPTWEFADGSREPATLSPRELADRTGCTI